MGNTVLKQDEPVYNRSGVSNPTFQIISQYSKFPVERMEFDDFVLVFNSPYEPPQGKPCSIFSVAVV
jgi:hypothetical protein